MGKQMDLNESIVLDSEFQRYLDICDQIAKESAVGAQPVINPQPGVPQVNMQKPIINNQADANKTKQILQSLRQMKQKVASGQDVTNDLQAILKDIN